MGVLIALGACGEDAPEAGPDPSAQPNVARPEGPWTAVRWLTSRSDATSGFGQATERRYRFEPACAAGPCDIVVIPNGADGSFLPDGYVGSEPTPGPAENFTLTWQAATSTYEYVQPPTRRSCTTVDSRVVPDAYESATKITLRFSPPAAGRPAALHGTYAESAKGVGAGIAAKCTDYESVWTIAGAPDRTAPDPATDLAGTYVVTEVVEEVRPAGERAPGFAGILLPSSTVARAGSGYTIGGTAAAPVTLSLTPTGWGGKASAPAACGEGEEAIPDGYTQTEEWIDLRPVAVTAAGDPVMVGRWDSRWEPTAGNESRCPASSNKGYVLLIPRAATSG
jgi:hypothetical protein